MALHLDLTGLLDAGGDARVSRETFGDALPRAARARAEHEAAEPAWRGLHARDDLAAACRRRAAQILEQEPHTFVVLGIGGSALGGRALVDALAPLEQARRPAAGRPRVLVVDNVDPDWMGSLFEDADPARTHFNVISKSGGTIETAAQFLAAWEAVRRAVGDEEAARRRFTVTTGARRGHFRALCDDLGFASLPVPDGVGGRFSVLSPVGLLTAEIAGADVDSLLAGAARVDRGLRELDPGEDPALAWALAHVLHLEAGRNVHVHFPYAHRMRSLAEWFRQLWAESLGKRRDRAGREVHVGPTPVGAVGVTDQHSQVQLFVEGPDDKVYTMLKLGRFEREVPVPEPFADSPAFANLRGAEFGRLLEAERQGTEVALADAGRPLCVLELCRLDAFHLGQYFAFFEIATAYAGGILGIDPFDQPGVEAGKVAALALMGAPEHAERAGEIRARLSRERVRLSV